MGFVTWPEWPASFRAVPEPPLIAAFRAHIERRLSLDGVPPELRDPLSVCDLLRDNAEPMPTSLCVLLRLPPRSSYAQGVRELRGRLVKER